MSDPTADPFREEAERYDEEFGEGVIGRALRAVVWRHAEAAFPAGAHLLDLGCGTGIDAAHLARRGHRVSALDASRAMLDRARSRVSDAGVSERVSLRQLPIERVGELGEECFDGVLSNFGALNCVADPAEVAEALAPLLRPGAPALLCLMGPIAPWEWLWYLARLRPRKAFRRLARGGVTWRGLTVRYPSIGHVTAAFHPWFRRRAVVSVRALIPGSYAESMARRFPGVVAALDALERPVEALPPFPWLADHYLLVLERREED